MICRSRPPFLPTHGTMDHEIVFKKATLELSLEEQFAWNALEGNEAFKKMPLEWHKKQEKQVFKDVTLDI